jgi:hypothetical protein
MNIGTLPKMSVSVAEQEISGTKWTGKHIHELSCYTKVSRRYFVKNKLSCYKANGKGK